MLKRFHKFARILAVFALLVAAAGVGAPYLRADYFASRIQNGLEQSLGRKVKIGGARYNVFRGPGFQVSEVTISEDERIGIEPFAHVAEVQCRVDFWSLLGGKIRFSNLRLVEPSVNLARNESGQWNVDLFLQRTSTSELPPIQVRDGRVNFKFGDRKSVLFLGNADMDLEPSSTGPLGLSISAEPFRTDRPAFATGRFHLTGKLDPATSTSEPRISAELESERSSIPEVAKLLGMRDPGVKGFLATNFTLKGPLSTIEFKGAVRLDDVSGSIYTLKSSAASLPLEGRINVRGHEIEVHSAKASSGQLPLMVWFHAKDYLATPDWGGQIKFENFPAPALFDVAERMDINAPAGFKVESGSVSGTITFSRDQGATGDIELTGAAFQLPAGGKLAGDGLQFEVTGQKMDLRIHSAAVEAEPNLTVAGSYDIDARAFDVTIRTKAAAPISETMRLAPSAPVFSQFKQGAWRGFLRYSAPAEGPAQWSAQAEVLDGVLDVPGLASPVAVSFAGTLNGDRLVLRGLRGSSGKVHFTGDYRYEAKAVRPHKLNLAADQLDLAEVERLFKPTLARGGFLAKTFRLTKAQVPDWLLGRRVEGVLRFGKVDAGSTGFKLEAVSARYQWDGAKGLLRELKAQAAADSLEIDGEIDVDLSNNQPRYVSTGRIGDVPVDGGRVDLEGRIETEGLGSVLLDKLRSQGEFTATDVRFTPDAVFDEIRGTYKATYENGAPRVTLADLNLTQAGDVYQGQGSTQPDGKLVLELTGPKKQLRLLGSLTPAAVKP
jgi:hypothetical protein